MADVFLSYARNDRVKAERIKQALEKLGLTIFFDVEGLDGGDVFPDVLDREVKTAGAVISLWTPWSLSRAWVKQECSIGLKRRVLIPVTIEPLGDLDVPLAFEGLQQIDLIDFHGDLENPDWQKLRRALARTLNRADLAPPLSSARAAPTTTQAVRAPVIAAKTPAPVDAASSQAPLIMLLIVVLGASGLWFANPFGWRAPDASTNSSEGPPILPVDANIASPDIGAPPAPAESSAEPSRTPDPIQPPAGIADAIEAPQRLLAETRAAPAAPPPRPIDATLERTLPEAFSYVRTAAFSPDGSLAATGSWDGYVRLWETATGRLARQIDVKGYVNSIGFSPDGSLIVTASSSGSAHVWNVQTGQSVFALAGHSEDVFGATFSPDGSRIATASGDKTARLWDSRTGQAIATLPHNNWVRVVLFSADGARLISTSNDGVVSTWDPKTGQPIATISLPAGERVLAISRDGRRMLTQPANVALHIRDPGTGKLLVALSQPATTLQATFSADGSYVMGGHYDKTARIWDTASGAVVAVLASHTDTVDGVALSSDGVRAITTSQDRTAKIWRLERR